MHKLICYPLCNVSIKSHSREPFASPADLIDPATKSSACVYVFSFMPYRQINDLSETNQPNSSRAPDFRKTQQKLKMLEKNNIGRTLGKTARSISDRAARTVQAVSTWQKRDGSFRFLDLPPGKPEQLLIHRQAGA